MEGQSTNEVITVRPELVEGNERSYGSTGSPRTVSRKFMTLDPKKYNPATTVYLIDGSSFLYRAYYSLRPLHTPAGVAVQAVYGFCRMIKKLIDTFDPSYMALVWDSKGKT